MTLFELPPEVSPHVDDETLLSRLTRLAAEERVARADFILHLAVFDERRLYLSAGYPSLFTWLTGRLGFSNAAAYRRSTACRLCAGMPAVGSYLREGRISLTKLCFLRDILSPDNCLALLERAAVMSEKEVAKLAVQLGPPQLKKPRDSIRPLPPVRQGQLFDTSVPEAMETSPVQVQPTSVPEVLHQVKMTVGPEFLSVLDRVRAAMSHTHPGGSLEDVLLECMRIALRTQEKRTRATTNRPRIQRSVTSKPLATRYVPASVRRRVWQRDQARCTYVSPDGKPCGATHRLELHHLIPFARGGPATADNLALRCRPHNDLAARADFGDARTNDFSRSGTHRPRVCAKGDPSG